ncbi:spore coat protein U domain-containing protein [Thermosynechococcus sp. FA-CM-4201]
MTAAPDLDFGAFTQDTAKDGNTSFTVKCNASDQVTIKLESTNTCTSDVRTMTREGGGTLSYKLFKDAGKATLWPCTTPLNHNPSSPDGDSVTVYGQIQKPATLQPAGSYSDTVTITVTY